jgi:prephenate dehydrogenase
VGEIRTAAIIGTGLIGGSLGLALKSLAGLERVTGCARTQITLDRAVALGAIDEGFLDCAAAVKNADVVFIATPVSTIIEELRQIAATAKPGAIITDTASVKTRIVAEADAIARAAGMRFIGGHPMAGSEMSGVDAANADLFRNAAYILTPTADTDPDALQALHGLLGKTGARVFTLNPEAHDRVVGAISHLPHILSSSLVNVAAAGKRDFNNIFKLAAGGFYDMTRIAGSPTGIWVDICLENRTAIQELISQYQDELETFAELLKEGDADGIRLKLENARAVRQDLPRLKQAELPLVYELTVIVPNRPKVLSEITLLVADAGINIEDIQIVHSTEADNGMLRLSILGEAEARRVEETLTESGYAASVERRLK